MKPTGPSDPNTRKLIDVIKKNKEWKELAKALAKPRRQKKEVTLTEIEEKAKAGERVVVPYKVLSDGELTKPVTVYAWRFSAEAVKKIHAAGGKTLTLNDLVMEKAKARVI
jgi:large subunit ribosomal protein L18e